jgi:hypothetical protein
LSNVKAVARLRALASGVTTSDWLGMFFFWVGTVPVSSGVAIHDGKNQKNYCSN